MTNGDEQGSGHRTGVGGRRALGAIACAVILAGAAWAAADWAWRQARFAAETRAEATADLLAANLDGVLAKFSAVPEILASRPDVVDLFAAGDRPEAIDRANALTISVRQMTGADVVYFMRTDGLTFAASNWREPFTNWREPWSFVGRNFSFRPYFQDAMTAGSGRYFALGTTSLRRGYYFARRVKQGTRILGVVVVKVDLEAVESRWWSLEHEVVVTDSFGVVFLSNREDWRMRTVAPLTDDARRQIIADRRYDVGSLLPLQIEIAGDRESGTAWTVAGGSTGGRDSAVQYLAVSRQMPDAGWTVHVLTDLAPARRDAIVAAVLAVALCASLGLAGLLIWQRRRRLIERIAMERDVTQHLERLVADRTGDLTAANVLLGQEIEERHQAEAELRRMQAELVQAGKLAALGQMSAALSHEFNQPLAAIRTYADNAGLLLERGRVDQARENIDRIAELTGRMAEISRHLNTFARRRDDRRVPVDLCAVTDRVVAFLDDRRQRAGATIDVVRAAPELWVMAGEIRLEQVILNLLTNAIDAVADQAERKVEVIIAEQDGQGEITVADSGPGISADAIDRIFDPFFTTKRTGAGLGLGLSIAFNIVKDFDGRLIAANRDSGGAAFRVFLPVAQMSVRAAE